MAKARIAVIFGEEEMTATVEALSSTICALRRQGELN